MVSKTITGLKKAFGVTYSVDTLCENCNQATTLDVPFGVYVYEHLKEGAICKICGCRVHRLINKELDPDSLEKEHKRELMSLRERLRAKKDTE